jgi:hypothetical protein
MNLDLPVRLRDEPPRVDPSGERYRPRIEGVYPGRELAPDAEVGLGLGVVIVCR